MAGEQDGVLCGGRRPGPKGVCEEEPSGGGEGPIGLYASGQSAIPRPPNTARWELRRLGRVEIGFYHLNFTVNENKTAATIRDEFSRTSSYVPGTQASGYVDIGYDVQYRPRPANRGPEEVFQVYAFLTISGPFLPIEVRTKKAFTIKPPPLPDKNWEDARARLRRHEEGHIEQAWRDMINSSIFAEFGWEQNAQISYDEFRKIVERSKTEMGLVLPASGKAWDDADNATCTSDMSGYGLVMPIQVPPK